MECSKEDLDFYPTFFIALYGTDHFLLIGTKKRVLVRIYHDEPVALKVC